jgi:hypothetical protein
MDLGAYVIKGMYVFVMALGAYVRVCMSYICSISMPRQPWGNL